jgi:hypothetical protein
MYKEEILLQMLTDDKAFIRYQACELLRTGPNSSPEIVAAFEKAAQDEDIEVAEKARLALQTDIHRCISVSQRQVTSTDLAAEKTRIEETIQEHRDVSDLTSAARPPEDQLNTDLLQAAQAIKFVFGVVVLAGLSLSGKDIFYSGLWVWIIICAFLAFIVLQVYAIQKYGFMDSIGFLRIFLETLISSFTRRR